MCEFAAIAIKLVESVDEEEEPLRSVRNQSIEIKTSTSTYRTNGSVLAEATDEHLHQTIDKTSIHQGRELAPEWHEL